MIGLDGNGKADGIGDLNNCVELRRVFAGQDAADIRTMQTATPGDLILDDAIVFGVLAYAFDKGFAGKLVRLARSDV